MSVFEMSLAHNPLLCFPPVYATRNSSRKLSCQRACCALDVVATLSCSIFACSTLFGGHVFFFAILM